MTVSYSEFGGSSQGRRGRCVTCCGILFLLLALTLVSALGGVLGAYLYHTYFLNDNDSSNNSHHSSHSKGDFTDTLIFEDEFDTLNLDMWQHEITMSGGGNWEFEYYTNNRSNSYVRDGILYVKPTLTNNTYTDDDFLTSGTIDLWGSTPADQCTAEFDYGCFRTGSATDTLNPVQSARLRTVNSFGFKYGRVDVRAQLPRGDWLWPAIWMLPRKNYYGQWPASGEIDLIEARANNDLDCTGQSSEDGDSIGINQMATSLHWGPYYGADLYNMTHVTTTLNNGSRFSDGFHIWTMEWSPDGFDFYLDNSNTPYMTVNTGDGYWERGNFDTTFPHSFNPWNGTTGNDTSDAPFDQEFFIIINLAVGGTSGFFPDGCTSIPGGTMASYAKPWSDDSDTAYSDFWNTNANWYPTWYPFVDNGEGAALKVDYIRVYEYDSSQR